MTVASWKEYVSMALDTLTQMIERYERERMMVYMAVMGVAMRDPDRIDRVLDEIAFFWKAHPDMRLMQLLENVGESKTTDCACGQDKFHSCCMYSMEDDELCRRLRENYGT